ncbi:MAG: DUF4350 domain-containing protein, partial [Planctomycetota bacterium]
MSPNTNRSDYTILAILGLVTGLVLLAMVSRGLLREERSGRARVRTTRSTNVDAAVVCYTLFERLGLTVKRSDEMFTAQRHSDTGVIFSIDRLVPLGTGEIAELSDWLFQGGVFVTTRMPRGLSPALDRLGRDMPKAHRYLAGARARERSDRGGPTTVPVDARTLPLARDVATVGFISDGVFNGKWAEADSADFLRPLFADSHGVRIAEHAVGRGRVILLPDGSFLANGLIARADNAVLATNLASYALAQSGKETLVFDEYHFGHGSRHRGFHVLGGMLLTSSAGWAVLSLTAAGVLFLVHKGRQFGPRRGLAKERRRSKIEFVYAVGATLRAAGAHRLALEKINAWFRRRVTSATGLIPSASNDAIAHELARRGKLEARECRRILDDCDR